jgi:UDP-N-acetylglucosamine 2-epimerase (non-hydrolysing)
MQKEDVPETGIFSGQYLYKLTANALFDVGLSLQLDFEKPDIVLVQGDTTSAFTAALAAFYEKIPVGHIEAGLRTNNIWYPFPEEVNRCLISKIVTLHFAPTQGAFINLLREGVSKDNVFLTGNTVTDALYFMDGLNLQLKAPLVLKNKFILVTAHRRESFGEPLKNICAAIREIAKLNQDIDIVFPVHLNPNVHNVVHQELGGIDNIILTEPLLYPDLVYFLKRAYLILTDSGGIQEEAIAFGKPVLVLRNETERMEGIEAGVAKLVGTDQKTIVEETNLLLGDNNWYDKMVGIKHIYGDGKAGEKIVDIIRNYFDVSQSLIGTVKA